MTDIQCELLKVLSLNENSMQQIKDSEDLFEIYCYFKKLIPELTGKEFFEFISKAVNVAIESDSLEKLDESDLYNIVGGKSDFDSKLATFLASLTILNGNVVFANSIENSSNMSSGSLESSFCNVYSSAKKWVNNHSELCKKTLIGIGTISLTSVMIIGSVHTYKYSDNFFQRHVIGDDLRYSEIIGLPDNIVVTKINIDNQLIGCEYKSTTCSDKSLEGKYVIFYSGSGLSNVEQVRGVLDFYTSKGATVIGVDYSGFGQSGKELSGGKIRQKSIYSDAERIYKYVVEHYGVNASNILLHGYSLGGPVAAHVAANVSSSDNRLYGLVLQSSMKNTANAAYGSLEDKSGAVRVLGSIGGFLFADQFDCEKELKKLFKKDPNIKIAICGGGECDFLRLEKTRLDEFLKKYGFKNITVHNGSEGHINNGSAPRENFVLPKE